MSTLARRSSRVLVVAAVSTTGWVAGTAGASAAPSCEPLQPGCTTSLLDFTSAFTQKTTETYTDKVTIIRERTHTVLPVEVVSAPEPTATLAEPEPTLVTEAPACPHWSAYDALLQVPLVGQVVAAHFARDTSLDDNCEVTGGMVVEKSVQAGDVPAPVVPTPTPPQVTVENNVEAPADATVGSKSDSVKTNAVAGGVDVDRAEAHDGTAVAPEQHEVSGPATVSEALPKTGANGAALTMLGLALIASGAAVRTAARD